MKQTAVEWLVDYCDKEVGYIPIEIINQAKSMEKEQIKNAWLNSLTKGDFNSAEQYYNETYESNNCLLNDGCDGIRCYNCINNRNL